MWVHANWHSSKNTIYEKDYWRSRHLIQKYYTCHVSAKSLSRTAPRSHSLSSSCCLWSHERLPQGSAPAGSLVWCTEQLWGSQEALSGFSLWRSLVLAIWKDGSCSGTGSKMSWLHSAGKTRCCKIPGLTWIPWDGTKQMCLLRQAAISWITLYIWQEINLLSTTLTKVFYFVPSFSLGSLRISRFLCVTRKSYHRHLFASKRHYDLLLAVNIRVQCIWSLCRAAHTGAEQKGKWEHSKHSTAQWMQPLQPTWDLQSAKHPNHSSSTIQS